MFLEVVNNLFLGDKNTARNYSEIEKAGVSLVVSVGGGCLQLPGGVEHVRLHVRDDNQDSLLQHLHDVVKLIEQHVTDGDGVLVHCQAGVSRSPAVVMGYLIRYRGSTVEEALATVRRVRPRARPREKLMDELHEYFQLGLAERNPG